MNLVIVGATPRPGRGSRHDSDGAEVILQKVQRVLNSAGSTKREMEAAIDRARDLI